MFPQSYGENSSICPKSSLRNNLTPIPKFHYSRFWQKGSYLPTLALRWKSFQSQPFHTFLFSRKNAKGKQQGTGGRLDAALGDVFSSLSSTSHTPCRSGQVTEPPWALRVHQKWKLRQDALEALIPTFCFNLSSSSLIILDVFSHPSSMPLCVSELKAL